MALEKLEEMGYKPRRRVRVEKPKPTENIESILREIERDKAKRYMLNLLVEGLSEPDPREIIIYGMHVKKKLAPVVPAMREERIERVLEWLDKAIEYYLKHGKH